MIIKLKVVSYRSYLRVTWLMDEHIFLFFFQTADVAAAPITVTAPRKAAVDFTYPFMASGIQALVLRTNYITHHPFRVVFPFTIEVWTLSIFIFFLVALMLWAANQYDPYEWKHTAESGNAAEERAKDFTFWNSLWFCASTLFLQSSDHTPRSNAGRCITAFWNLYVIIMVFLYIVNVQFFITTQTRYNYAEDVADIKGEKTIKYGTTYKGTDTYHVFKATKSLKSMWHKMNNHHKSPYVKNLKEGVAKVRRSNGRFALLGQAPILRYIASQKPCDVDVTGPYLHRGQYAFAVTKDSPLADHISGALEALRDNGVLEELHRDYWDLDDRWGRCRNQTRYERSGAHSLLVNDLNGVYYLLCIGIGAAILVFIGECVYYSCCGGREKKTGVVKAPKKSKDISNKGGKQNAQGSNDQNMWI